MRIAPDERVVMIYGGCYNGNCGGMWRVRTGGQSVVSAKPCCERCERKFRNQQKASCETCETSETALISMLQKELDRKNEQLSVKDKQIEELNARLAEVSSALVAAQQTAQAAQVLHAGTIQQQLLTDGVGADQQSQKKPEQPRNWWSRLFGK